MSFISGTSLSFLWKMTSFYASILDSYLKLVNSDVEFVLYTDFHQ